MDSLIIEATEDSPSVLFDTSLNRFVISGESRPENVGKFYNPVIEWISKLETALSQQKKEKKKTAPIAFAFKLDYFNSTSAKYLMDIILVLKKIIEQGHEINIEWHYDKRDDDMLDAGKEFAETVEMEFNFIEY